jgi:D-alanine-D-alanine ligase
LVIKPVDQGSAVGVNIIKFKEELKKIIDKSLKTFPWLMAQKFIKGKEATCGVLEVNGETKALPPTHILPNLGKFYDYKSKYSVGGSTHICPADFDEHINLEIQKLAIMAHKALGCRGMSRTDVFVGDDKHLYILETNTIPGMTPTSLFPEAATKAGIDFSVMLDYIIRTSLK